MRSNGTTARTKKAEGTAPHPGLAAIARLLARDLARHPPEKELSASPEDGYLLDSPAGDKP
jgi:hypothetical protein